MIRALLRLFRKPKPEPKPVKQYRDCPCFRVGACSPTCDRGTWMRETGRWLDTDESQQYPSEKS